MSTVLSELTNCIKNFDGDTNVSVDAQLYYPKLIIIRNHSIITVVDLKDKEKKETHYELNQKIKDTLLFENLLWIILDSGEIIVLDLDTPFQIKIDNDNHKFWRFLKNDTILILISESRECFKPLYSSADIFKKIGEKLSILPPSFEKVPKQYSFQQDQSDEVINWNGFNISTETDSVVFKCITTGLSEFIHVNGSFEHAVPWGPYFVLSGDLNSMWLTDLINSNIIHKFSDGEGKYYPVAENNNVFYYILWSEDEIRVCSAWIATSSNIEAFGNRNTKCFTVGPLSQKCLKSHLEYLIESESKAEPFQLLIKIKHFFECIEDISYLLEIAVQLCKTNISFKTLLFKIQKRAYTVGSNNCESHITKNIRDILIKIELLEYISFRGNNAYEKIDFFRKNFVELCVTFLAESDLDLATICMLKYLNNNLSLTYDEVTEILSSIPYNIKMSAITVWLKSFVPPLLDINPYYIDIFVKWTMERVFRLEQSSYWPKIGLKFVDEIMAVLKLSLKSIPIRPMSMDELDKLRYHIDHITELKEKYKINILLDELSSLSPREMALIMLRRCYTEDLNGFLKDYLPAYVSRHVFGLDDTLFSYIEIESASSGGVVDSCRLEMLLNSFCSNTSRLDCLLRVLRVLDVPWDSTMLDLAVSAGESINKDYTVTDDDKLLAQEIQRELNYAKVKVVLKKYYFPLTCVDYKLVLHKIINAPIVDLNDLKVLINVMRTYSAYAYMMYLNRCLQDCQTRKALEFFNELTRKEKKVIFKTMLFKFEQIIEQNLCSTVVEKNYLDFLKGSLINDAKMNAIECLYHLKNSYNITLNLNKIFSENFCAKQATLITSANSGSTASSEQRRCVTLLTASNQTRQSRLFAMLRRTSTAPNVRKHVEAFFTSVDKELSNSITPILTHFTDGYNTSDLLESYSVLVELIVNCVEEDLHFIVKFTSVFNSLIKSNIIMKNLSMTWKFHYIYLPISSIKALNYLIGFYANTSFEESSRKEILDICNRCDITAFRMITDITEYYISRKFTEELHEFKDKVLKRLISKVIGFQDIDEILLTNLLLIFNIIDEENCKEWIIDASSGQNDFLPPSITRYLSSAPVLRMFSLDNIFKNNALMSQPQYILKTKFNMNLADIAMPDITEETWDVKLVLFYALKLYPNTNFETLLELCRTLNVSLDYGLSLQLISVLSTWELKYIFFNDDLGCRQIYIKSNKEDLLSKAFVIWESIKNKEFVKDVLNDFWRSGEISLHGRLVSINPYYYEVYFCIYHLLYRLSTESRNVKEYLLLNFLVDYERKTSPKQYEFELFSVKGSFPEIGHYRLPFILFMRDDIWSNLKTEITLETYERWLPVIPLVDIKVDSQNITDLICTNALKQTMTLLKRSEGINLIPKTNEPWRLTAKDEPLLRAAHKCVKYITNMEWAGACLFYVLQGCARGADQVNTSKLCYQFAQRWAAIQPVNRVVRQMEHFYLTLSTQHALQKIDWACDEFISLITEPTQLIRSLYVHPDFVEKMMRHDINRAANEIADSNGINVSSIRFQILESILDKSDKESKTKNVSCLNNKELMTVKYILRATCSKMGAIYLSRIAFDDDSEFNKTKKLRALQCLMSVVDKDTAVKVTNRERETLWSSLLELSHVVKLENIDMPWIVATFRQDKVRATEQLLQSVGSNVAGLKIAAELALKYGDEYIICNLIPHLLRASLYDETVALLIKSSSPPDEILRNAWRTIILYPFQRADYPITERQRENCLNVINLLPVCPVIRDEDLIEIWKHCLRFKCIGLGCLVLPYMTQEARISLTELHKIDKRSLIASLKNLHSESYLVSSAMCVVESLPLKVYRKQP